MIIRALDATGDWTFGQGKQNYLIGQKAIALNIQTRLLSFLNDCFFDLNAGIDWINLLGSTNTKVQIELSVKAVILKSYGVLRINSLSSSFVGRRLSLTYNIDTIFTANFTQSLNEVINNA